MDFSLLLQRAINVYNVISRTLSTLKINLQCVQKLAQRLYYRNYERLLHIKQQQSPVNPKYTLFVTKLSCSEILVRSKLNTNFKNRFNLMIHPQKLIDISKPLSQSHTGIPYPPEHTHQLNELEKAFRSLMDTCLKLEKSNDIEQGFAFNSVCEFVNEFIEEIRVQLDQFTEVDLGNRQVVMATKVSTAMNFIEELLQSPLVYDIHLHWFCTDRIEALLSQCIELGERLHERK